MRFTSSKEAAVRTAPIAEQYITALPVNQRAAFKQPIKTHLAAKKAFGAFQFQINATTTHQTCQHFPRNNQDVQLGRPLDDSPGWFRKPIQLQPSLVNHRLFRKNTHTIRDVHSPGRVNRSERAARLLAAILTKCCDESRWSREVCYVKLRSRKHGNPGDSIAGP